MPLVLVAALLAADAITFDVAARTEGRMGAAPNDPRRSTAQAAQFDGLLGLNAKLDNITLTGAYSPRLVETPPPQGSGLAVIHGMRLGVEYRTSPTGHLLLQELGSFGRNDFSPLIASVPTGPVPGPVVDPRLPIKALLANVESDTSLSVEQSVSRRLSLRGSAGWLVSGGADAIAQRYLPLQRGPHASAGVSWTATPADRLSLSSAASYATFTNGSTSRILTATGGWGHEFSPNTRAEIGVGSGIGETTGPSAGGSPTPFPSVSGSLSHNVPLRGGSVSGSLQASATPQVDRTSGDVYELANGSLGLNWTIDRLVRLGAIGSFGRALSGPSQVGAQLITAEGSASFPIGPLTAFALGARSAWQSVPPTAPGVLVAPGFQWAVFTSLIVGTHGTL